jgi:hypothetical protein
MIRHDDTSIAGDLALYRRIPPGANRVTWDEHGNPVPSSFNFKDAEDELSLHIAQETTPDVILAGNPGFGLVYLTARQIRDECGHAILICRDDQDPADGHVLVCGKISDGMAKRLSKLATKQWVQGYWPNRVSP